MSNLKPLVFINSVCVCWCSCLMQAAKFSVVNMLCIRINIFFPQKGLQHNVHILPSNCRDANIFRFWLCSLTSELLHKQCCWHLHLIFQSTLLLSSTVIQILRRTFQQWWSLQSPVQFPSLESPTVAAIPRLRPTTTLVCEVFTKWKTAIVARMTKVQDNCYIWRAN